MFVNEYLKKKIGEDNYFQIRQFIKSIRDEIYFVVNKKIQHNKLLIVEELFQSNKHVFFGYYDINQFSEDETKILVHVVNKDANVTFDNAEIGYYDIISKKYYKIAETKAWCWQQGSRLRWSSVSQNQVLFNDVENDMYVTRIYDINDNQIVRTINSPLYDVDEKMKYGLSVNFSRIQRLRPGYGYCSLPDNTILEKAPINDGIFLVDLENNEKKLIISLYSLMQSNMNCGDNYVNHISVCPNGEKFMFFHIWTIENGKKWKTRLYVANLDGTNLKLLEDDCELVSHYDWIDNENIIITSYNEKQELRYYIYNTIKCSKQIINSDKLQQDGHPTVLNDKKSFITDTYPIKYDMQTLFYFDNVTMDSVDLLKVYSNPNLYGEKRCDLHPRLSLSEKYIVLDSTVKNGLRREIVIKNWKELLDDNK